MDKANFIFTPQMLIAASDMNKDFENVVTYLEFKGGQYLFECGELYDEGDDPVYEAMTHLFPFANSYESTLASVIKMLNAIGFWREYMRTGDTRLISNYATAITAYALEANDMAHELTALEVEEYKTELIKFEEKHQRVIERNTENAKKLRESGQEVKRKTLAAWNRHKNNPDYKGKTGRITLRRWIANDVVFRSERTVKNYIDEYEKKKNGN